MNQMSDVLADQRLKFIPADELAPAELFNPDSTRARQFAIGQLMRLLDKERRACVVVEALAEEFKTFRTMQCVTRLSNAEAQLRHAGEAVALSWERYTRLTPPGFDDPAVGLDVQRVEHGGRE